MLEYDFLKVVGGIVKPLREFALPAIVTNDQFVVYWSNPPARNFFSHLTETRGLEAVLTEYDRAAILEALSERGCYTINDIIPLSGTRMSLWPVMHERTLAGIIILLIGADNIINIHSFQQSSRTVDALSSGAHRAVGDVFDIMDIATVKADIMDMSWIKPSFERIAFYGYRILRMTQNIAEFARFQRGLPDMQFQAVDLFAFLRDVSGALCTLANSAGIPLTFEIPHESAFVRLDRERFQQALFNVLHNSLYFTRSGNRVTISIGKDGATVFIRVRDCGPGIPAEFLPDAFRPYASYDYSGKQPTIGLGLTIAKLVMDAHDAGVHLESVPGEGTTVTFEFLENAFSSLLPMAQNTIPHLLDDRFSSLYIALGDISITPYLIGDTTP